MLKVRDGSYADIIEVVRGRVLREGQALGPTTTGAARISPSGPPPRRSRLPRVPSTGTAEGLSVSCG